MEPHPSSASERKRERSGQGGNWLISTLAWGPLLSWVAWPLLDEHLAWQPVVGYSAFIALILNWVYSGELGVDAKRWPAWVAILVAFDVSFSVAAGSSHVGTFAAVSILAGGLLSSVVGGLVVILGVRLARIRDYRALEDTILLTAPGVEGAMIASITIGSIASDPGTLPIGIAAGLAAGLVVSVFVLAWVYGAVGIALSWVVKTLDEPHQAWWPSEFQPGQSMRK